MESEAAVQTGMTTWGVGESEERKKSECAVLVLHTTTLLLIQVCRFYDNSTLVLFFFIFLVIAITLLNTTTTARQVNFLFFIAFLLHLHIRYTHGGCQDSKINIVAACTHTQAHTHSRTFLF